MTKKCWCIYEKQWWLSFSLTIGNFDDDRSMQQDDNDGDDDDDTSLLR